MSSEERELNPRRRHSGSSVDNERAPSEEVNGENDRSSPLTKPVGKRSRHGRSENGTRSPSPKRDRKPRRRSESASSETRKPKRSSKRSRSPSQSRGHSSKKDTGRSFYGQKAKPSNCLGVFGMSVYTTERDLKEVFGKFGAIEEVKLVYDRPSGQTGKSRGFGFIYFENKNDAVDAKEAMADAELDGHRIRIDYSYTARPHSPTPGQYMGPVAPRPYHGGRGPPPFRGGHDSYGGTHRSYGGGVYYGPSKGGHRRARHSPSDSPPPRRHHSKNASGSPPPPKRRNRHRSRSADASVSPNERKPARHRSNRYDD